MTRIAIRGKTLWRIPQQGKLMGVCAGLAHYLDIPVRLLRVIVVLSMIFGLFFFTLVAYFALGFVLDPMPADAEEQGKPSASELLDDLDHALQGGETAIREMERYVTSETFSVRSRFRQL